MGMCRDRLRRSALSHFRRRSFVSLHDPELRSGRPGAYVRGRHMRTGWLAQSGAAQYVPNLTEPRPQLRCVSLWVLFDFNFEEHLIRMAVAPCEVLLLLVMVHLAELPIVLVPLAQVGSISLVFV